MRVANLAELLELEKQALDEVTRGIEVLVERIFERARWVVGYDSDRILGGDGLA